MSRFDWPHIRRLVFGALLLLYMALLAYLTLFPGPFRRAGGEPGINLRPLATILRYAAMAGLAVWINLAGNILAFLPLGFLWPLAFPRHSRLLPVLLISLAVSLMVEAAQYLTAMGSLDVDDIILNVLGGLAGWGLRMISRRVHGGLL